MKRGAIVLNARRGPFGSRHALPATVAFHRTLSGYRATPLVALPDVARELRVGALVVKDEELRLGLPSFKILGSSWALHELVRRRLGRPAGQLVPVDEMREHVRKARATLCAASDGNYGRSIAALGETLGCGAVIFLPADTAAQRVVDVRSHGANVELVAGSYEETVTRARAASAERGYWYCPDTALSDASASELTFVRDVAAGYTTLFAELMEQLGRPPDLIFVQAGVGGLASAAVLACDALAPKARLVTVEPEASPCVQASIAAGRPRAVRDTFTIMAGLRCQSVSAAAWPLLRDHVTAALTIGDDDAVDAMRLLAAHGVIAGESGAAGVAAVRVALSASDGRVPLDVEPSSLVVALNTEGATDRASYERIVRR